MITYSQCNDSEFEAVCDFHRKSYGIGSYQSNPSYLKWLYQENPHSDLSSRGWVARDESDEIVGCIHIMTLLAYINDMPVKVHSLQNLIINEDLRGGAGMILVKRALKNSDLAIFPGVAQKLADTYRAINYEEVPSYWGKYLLNRIKLPWNVMAYKLGYKLDKSTSSPLRPEDSEIAELCKRLQKSRKDSINWTPEFVKWRFFSPNGPKHHLYIDNTNPNAFCVASIGIRKNTVVARFIEYGSDVVFLKSVIDKLKYSGAELLLCYAATDEFKNILENLNLTEVEPQPTSFIKRSRTLPKTDLFLVTPGCTDLGFDSIGTIL